MEQYNVTGMSCAACVARVEKAVSAVDGVSTCSVSLLTNSMGVEGNADETAIIKAVADAGYVASKKSNSKKENGQGTYEDELVDRETPLMKKRLLFSIILLVPLMYVSMGHMLWNWPLPTFMVDNHVAMGLYELLLAGIIMVINQRFFVSGFKALLHKSPNMDTLVALGATASFGYSVYALFAMTTAMKNGDMAKVNGYMEEFYFESAAMILTLITVGKMLEAKSKGKTTDALKSLMKLAPKTAVLVKNDIETVVPISQVKVGDHFAVKPGESIPVDGFIVEGSSAINEASLTGESVPVDKTEGDEVSAATINQSGYLICEATRVGEDTTLSQIIRMVSDAAATKAPIAKVADKVSGVFVPAVMFISAVTFITWMIVGQTVGFALARAISVLVISCPCALGLATPVAIMVGNGMGAKSGIMFKTAISLEQTGKVQILALDKTGTITKGEPELRHIICAEGVSEEELLAKAYALEAKSEHPLAKAIVEKAQEKELKKGELSDFLALTGSGVSGMLDGHTLTGGNAAFISKKTKLVNSLLADAEKYEKEGETVLFFAEDDRLLGAVSVADVIKKDSASAIKELKDMGIHVVMLTGDNEKTAKAIGDAAGVDEVVAGLKPDGKESVIRKLKESGMVAMVGDGINDALALTTADVGIAIGAGTDVAIDAADLVLIKSRLSDVPAAIRLSQATLRNIHENLFWAFIYNIIGIPLAAGVWIHLFGWTLNPMFGAAAMSLSSFCVVTNALRLNLFDMHNIKNAKIIKNPVSRKMPLTGDEIKVNENMEEKKMEITVNGMMCKHCEAHVKEAIEKIEGVVSAVSDHENKLVTIETNGDVAEEKIKEAVETAGYEYVGIR